MKRKHKPNPAAGGRANTPRHGPSHGTGADTFAGGACKWKMKHPFVKRGLPFQLVLFAFELLQWNGPLLNEAVRDELWVLL